MSGEIGLGTLDTKNWREINIQIEEDLNNYLKSINYCPYLDSPWVVSPDFKGFPVFLSSNLYLSAG
jgi:alkyl hydroperoxide reductase subunit AhpF